MMERLRRVCDHLAVSSAAAGPVPLSPGLPNDAIQAQFRADGFVVVPSFFSEPQLQEIEGVLAHFMAGEMLEAEGPWDGHCYTCEQEGDLSTVWRIGLSAERTPFWGTLGGGRLADLFTLVMGARPAMPLMGLQYFDKTPSEHSRPTPPHQSAPLPPLPLAPLAGAGAPARC